MAAEVNSKPNEVRTKALDLMLLGQLTIVVLGLMWQRANDPC